MRKCKDCRHKGFCAETSRLYGVPQYHGGCKYFEEKKRSAEAEQALADMKKGKEIWT